MKKITTILMLLMLTCMGAWAQDYSGIEISFNKPSANETDFMNVTPVVTDLNGNPIEGVTAEPVSWAASDLVNSSMNSGTVALSWTNKVLIGGRYSNNNSNTANAQNFVIKISGLRAGFSYDAAEVDLYGCNGGGAAVSNNNIAITCGIQTGNSASSLSDFVSTTGNNINGSQEGGLWHKVTTMRTLTAKTVNEGEDLYVKVNLQKTGDSGTQCRPSFRTVRLYGPVIEGTSFEYIVNGTNFLYFNSGTKPVTSSGFCGLLMAKEVNKPALSIKVGANATNNIQFNENYFVPYRGGSAISHYLTVPTGYVITEYSMVWSTKSNTGATFELQNVADGTYSATTEGDVTTFAVTGVNASSTSYDFASNDNYGITNCVFTVKVEQVATTNITYKVVDADGNTLASQVVEKEIGAQITDLPAEMKRDFTTYTSTPITVTEGGENVFTATATFNTPFEISTDFDNAKWYYLNLKNGEGFPTYVESGNPNVTLPGTNAENDNTSWAFIGNTYQGFQIINKAAGGNVVLGSALNVQNDGGNGGNTYATLNAPGTKACETWTIESSSIYTNGFFIRNTDGHALNHRSANNLAYWSGGADAGSTFTVAKVPEREISYIQALDEMENGKVYAIYNSRGIWKFADNATSMSTENVPGDLDALCATPADAYQIGIVKQNDKYYLYNVAQKKYLAAGNKLYTSPLEAVTITQSTSGAATGNYKWFFSFDGSHNINVSQGNVLIDGWSTHDGGNVNAIMVTDATYTVEDALAPFTDYTQCITDYCAYKEITTDFVQNLGQFGYPKAGTVATTAFTDILARNASGANTAEDFNTFMEKYNAVFAAENMKMPEPGNFYRIKGYSGNYITLNTAGSNASMSGEANINNIVCYTPDNQLVFYANGLGMYNTSIVAPLGTTLNTYTFLGGAQKGHFYIKSNASDVGTYCYDNTANGSKVDRNGSPVTSGDYQTDWTLEEVTELPITLRSTDGTNYFATFSAPVNVEISGASLNNVQKDGNTATFTTVNTNVLKAGVGVLLSGTSESATATVITDEVDEANYGLVSYYAATAGTGDETKYYLGKSKKSGQAGFYKLGSGTTSNGFKAYLENTTGEAKEGFDLEFAGVTGIDNMENGTLNMENGAVYNLQGQRVNKAQKGVFIQNGKKVVVR